MDGGIAPTAEAFVETVCIANPNFEESLFQGFNLEAFNMYANDFIGNTTQDNEGWSGGICYAIISQVTRMLNGGVYPKPYAFKIFPVVKEERDRRENEYTDISVIKIKQE